MIENYIFLIDLEIISVEVRGLRSYYGGNPLGQYFVSLFPRGCSIFEIDPIVDFPLEPRNCNPSK